MQYSMENCFHQLEEHGVGKLECKGQQKIDGLGWVEFIFGIHFNSDLIFFDGGLLFCSNKVCVSG